MKKTIVKSKRMQQIISNSTVIPNGTDFSIFRNIDKLEAIKKANFNSNNKNIIFIAQDIKSKIKNFKLAEEAVKCLNNKDVVFHKISQIPQEELVYYYNAADLLLLTSLSEGSPNVIKKAMACICPIVSTDVGDVSELIDDLKNCFIDSYSPEDIADKIKLKLKSKQRSDGVFFTDIIGQFNVIELKQFKRFQAYQAKEGTLEFRLEAEIKLSHKNERELKNVLELYIYEVEITYYKNFVEDDSGKFRYVLSELGK